MDTLICHIQFLLHFCFFYGEIGCPDFCIRYLILSLISVKSKFYNQIPRPDFLIFSKNLRRRKRTAEYLMPLFMGMQKSL